MRRPAPIAMLLVVLMLSGCLFGSPSASPSSSAEGSQAGSAQPSTSAPPPTATPVPTPGPVNVGTTVSTSAGGLRVRSGPGLSQGVLTLLPAGANLVVELGPVRVDDWGWYLVRDADADEPTFEEGWVAAGFMPSPYLVPATFELPENSW